MKKKEKSSLQAMTQTQLQKILLDAKTACAIYSANRLTKQVKNTREGTALRRKIAFVATVLRQKEHAHE